MEAKCKAGWRVRPPRRQPLHKRLTLVVGSHPVLDPCPPRPLCCAVLWPHSCLCRWVLIEVCLCRSTGAVVFVERRSHTAHRADRPGATHRHAIGTVAHGPMSAVLTGLDPSVPRPLEGTNAPPHVIPRWLSGVAACLPARCL